VSGGETVYWLAMITSAKRSGWAGDVPIPDLSEAGVHGPCLVRSAKIATLEHMRVDRKIGRISQPLLREVTTHIRRELERACGQK
jgi:hypothetical protein